MTSTIPFLRLFSSDNTKEKRNKNQTNNLVPELLLVGLAAVSAFFWDYGFSATGDYIIFGLWIVILALLLALTFANLKTMLLPNELQFPLLISVIIYVLAFAIQQSDGALIWSSLFGALLLGGIPYALFQISAGKWIGGGDTKIGFTIGLLLGFKVSLLCAVVMFALVGLMFLVSKVSKSGAPRIETGIMWTTATVICMLFGQQIINILA